MITTKEEAFELMSQERNKMWDIDPYYCDCNTYFGLYMCCEELRNDIDIVANAIAVDLNNIKYANKKLFASYENMLRIIRISEYTFKYASDELKNNKAFVFDAIKINNTVYEQFDSKLKLVDEYFLKHFELYFGLSRNNSLYSNWRIYNEIIEKEYKKNGFSKKPEIFIRIWEIIDNSEFKKIDALKNELIFHTDNESLKNPKVKKIIEQFNRCQVD